MIIKQFWFANSMIVLENVFFEVFRNFFSPNLAMPEKHKPPKYREISFP
jgi:hypothetical protein